MFETADIPITPEVLTLIAEIDEFKGAWRALGTLAPERLSALRRVATIESIGSSTRIEGSKLSDRDVERLLANLEIKSFATRDEQEVAGYAEVMETIFHAWPEIPVTENHIKQLHRDLLRYSEKDDRHRGEYKTLPNSVAAFDDAGQQIAVVFETASPFDTPRLMAELVAWLREAQELKRLHPLLVIAIFTVVFLEIHPFQDGNGRLSRVLTTLLLLKAGYAYVPYSSLEGVIENSKEGYYLALRQTQGTHPHRRAELAAVADLFSAGLAAAGAAAGGQGGARAGSDCRPARAGPPDHRLRPPARPRHDGRHGPRYRRQPQHVEGPFPQPG